MSVAAAIRITSREDQRVIEQASALAKQAGQQCYVIAIVPLMLYGEAPERDEAVVAANLAAISASGASLVMHEADDVPQALVTVGRSFGVRTMFLQAGAPDGRGRSTAERLLYLAPPFDVIVLPRIL